MLQTITEVAFILRSYSESKDPAVFDCGCTMVSTLQLKESTEQVLGVYLSDRARSARAYTALVWLRDPAMVGPLLEAVKKEPASIERHAGLFQGPLAREKAPKELAELLESKEAAIRYGAASALMEGADESLAPAIANLAKETEPRAMLLAAGMAVYLPERAFGAIQDDLVPLLKADDPRVLGEVIRCYGEHKDARACPRLLELMKAEKIDPTLEVPVMRALQKIAGTQFGYDMHNWGPGKNDEALLAFEAWMEGEKARAGARPGL